MMYQFAKDWKSEVPVTHSPNEIRGAQGLAIFFLVLAGLWLCMLIFLRNRINLAIGLVKEAARAVIAMPIIMLYPGLQVVGLLLFLLPWVFYSVFVSSLGSFYQTNYNGYNGLGPTLAVKRFNYGSEGTGYAWYLLFCLLWTAQFIIAVGQLTLAMAISSWYFTRDKSTVGNSTLISAIHNTWYHLGTAAFGSLIIAIIEFIRAIISYMQKKVRPCLGVVPGPSGTA
jgi:hypothetical protein